MSETTRCSARVNVTLDIAVDSTWGGDCNISQVQKQAKEDARRILAKTFEKTDVRVVGDMQVRMIIVDD
jgi:hypothetical protein